MLPYYETGTTPITESNYTDFLAAWGDASAGVKKYYPLSRFNVTGRTQDAVVFEISHIRTAASYTCPSLRMLQAAEAAGTRAYAYTFDTTPSCPWLVMGGQTVLPEPILPYFGASHTAELPYIFFGNLDTMPFGQGNCSAKCWRAPN